MYNLDQTIELLQRAVAEKGDGHRSRCEYVDEVTHQPVCIVGHVLFYTGLINESIAEMTSFSNLVNNLEVIRRSFTPAAVRALAAAQDQQDGVKVVGGDTWGEALIAAKEVRP